ncbi:sugar diacid recognition domain-containing protein [Bacillus sp. FJAT-49736]|uniref:CdaR family transcriptional regulator n=1 Tax=Bacillus sp. FJAT-49736 TaxID=2833582 RepID=UPI001BC8DA23|nr:sugar diacid recognition domain-containing protein [Bacillus sp. FJAT-49736]MBS4174842.1 helix-turn-helix domain-containing protein [Bacillus sp. FJAT-49736]
MLTRGIAEEIVKQTTIRLHRNINIMDGRGVIIASGDRKRMDTAHFGAMEVLRTGKPLFIYEKDLHQWEGARPGINLPIEFQKKIIGVIGITGDPDEMEEFSELVKMITEMMIQQSFMIEQLEWKQRLKELVFEDLRKDSSNRESVQQRLHLIGVKLEPPFQVSTVEVNSEKFHPRELVQLLEGGFDPEHTLAGILSTNRLFLLNSYLSEKKVKEKLLTLVDRYHSKGVFVRIGLGSNVDSTSYIGNSYEESISALALGSKDQQFILYSDIESKVLLDQLDPWYKQQFSERIIGSLSDKLMETLEHFFLNDLNLSETAKSLYIHRNSLLYRMKKIKEITGYDPQKFHHATTLQIAIWMDQMLKKVK